MNWQRKSEDGTLPEKFISFSPEVYMDGNATEKLKEETSKKTKQNKTNNNNKKTNLQQLVFDLSVSCADTQPLVLLC